IGAIVGGAPPATLVRLTTYGEALGLSFQIADDILDALDDGTADGRTDAALGLDGARAHARRARDAAVAAIAPLGPKARMLASIAEHVVERAEAACRTARAG